MEMIYMLKFVGIPQVLPCTPVKSEVADEKQKV
jgi:hypothetical protein